MRRFCTRLPVNSRNPTSARPGGSLRAAGLLLACVAAAACGGGSSPRPPNTGKALAQVQAALDKAGGYTLDVSQANFVLPHWGGADSGTVQVNEKGNEARAVLARTGEPGATYEIRRVNGVTYFQRSTCEQWFRVPGGTGEVLLPYLFKQTQAIGKATDPSLSGWVIRATLPGLGLATIVVDPKTSRPIAISGAGPSGPFTWAFRDWGRSLDASGPTGGVQDRGPGGDPC